jgi:uncharacterized phiE125 gp8 family phage protein
MIRCSPECAWSLTTAPVLEPLTVEEAKAQIRSVQDQEDGVIDGYITAARQAAEDHLGRGLLTQSWTLALSEFVDSIPLPMAAPLASITSVKYYDTNGTQQTLSSTVYAADTRSRPGRVVLAAGQSWPAVQSLRKANRIEIEYIVGYASADLIPGSIRQGIRMYVGLMDVNRDGLDPGMKQAVDAIKAAFWTDRVFFVPPSYEEWR